MKKTVVIKTSYLKTTHDMIALLNAVDFDDQMTFDLSETFVRPYALLLLIFTIKKSLGEYTKIDYIKSNKEYLQIIGLYEYFDSGYKFSKLRTTQGFGTNICSFHMEDFLLEGRYINYDQVVEVSNQYYAIHNFDKFKQPEYRKFLSYFFQEIFRNSVEHSFGSAMTVYSHILPRRNLLEIAFFDNGRGLAYSLKKNPELLRRLEKGESPIHLALEPGVSSHDNENRLLPEYRGWENSGFGLTIIKDICLQLKGEFIISSEKEGLIFNSFTGKNESFKCNIAGVGIQIRFLFDPDFRFEKSRKKTLDRFESESGKKSSFISKL